MLSAKAIHAVQKRRLLYPSSPHAAHHDEAQHQSKSNFSKDVQKNLIGTAWKTTLLDNNLTSSMDWHLFT